MPDIAYHFVGKRLRDGRPVPKDGELLRFDGEPIMCKQGLHASVDPFDALWYAPGPILCKVRLGGKIVEGEDKVVATERTILARVDATDLCRYFARMQALSAVHLWDVPNIVLDYLMTGDESIRTAARRAAQTAAWKVAATQAVAWEAAWAAAQAASLARDALRAAARNAAEDTARADFCQLVDEAFECSA
jgi:hypothetical protein